MNLIGRRVRERNSIQTWRDGGGRARDQPGAIKEQFYLNLVES